MNADGYISRAETITRLRKCRHGCTSIANRDRLRSFLKDGREVSDKKLMVILPGLIRVEAQAVRAAADESGDKHLHQRADSLEAWAEEVYEDEGLQVAAVALLHKPPPGDEP